MALLIDIVLANAGPAAAQPAALFTYCPGHGNEAVTLSDLGDALLAGRSLAERDLQQLACFDREEREVASYGALYRSAEAAHGHHVAAGLLLTRVTAAGTHLEAAGQAAMQVWDDLEAVLAATSEWARALRAAAERLAGAGADMPLDQLNDYVMARQWLDAALPTLPSDDLCTAVEGALLERAALAEAAIRAAGREAAAVLVTARELDAHVGRSADDWPIEAARVGPACAHRVSQLDPIVVQRLRGLAAVSREIVQLRALRRHALASLQAQLRAQLEERLSATNRAVARRLLDHLDRATEDVGGLDTAMRDLGEELNAVNRLHAAFHAPDTSRRRCSVLLRRAQALAEPLLRDAARGELNPVDDSRLAHLEDLERFAAHTLEQLSNPEAAAGARPKRVALVRRAVEDARLTGDCAARAVALLAEQEFTEDAYVPLVETCLWREDLPR